MTAEKKNYDMRLLRSASVPMPFNAPFAFNTNRRSPMPSSLRKCLYLTAAIGSLSTFWFCNSGLAQTTTTPIKHVIVLIGENRTFDNIYGTYQPTSGQSVANLLSKGIVTASGGPGPKYSASMQFQIQHPYPTEYFIDSTVTKGKDAYKQSPQNPSFPAPNTAYVPTASGPAVLVGGFAQGPFDSSVSDPELQFLEPSLEMSDL